MRRMSLLIVAVFVVSAFTARSVDQEAGAPPSFDVRLTIYPATFQPYQLLPRQRDIPFIAEAFVREAGTNIAYASPRVTLLPGMTERKTERASGFEFDLAVKIDATATRARSELTIRKGSRVLARHASDVYLADRGPQRLD